MSAPVIRPAHDGDFAALTELYNHYVRETAITFDIAPFTLQARQPWFEQFAADGPYRLLVTEEAGATIGYAASMRFRPKAAYTTSVETSVYLAPEAGGRGLGSALYNELFRLLEKEDVHRAYAGVTLPNAPSIALHEKFGFSSIGIYREVGRKFDRYWDVAWFERALS